MKLSMTRGETVAWKIACVHDADGTPIDLTGATLAFTVKSLYSDALPLFEKVPVGQAPLVNGVALVTLAAADTEILDAASRHALIWDLLISNGGSQLVGASGTLLVKPNVSPVA